MKKMLLLLSLVAVPAWAEEAAPSTPRPEAMQTAAPVIETGVAIDLKGSVQITSALVAELEKQAAYKEAACSSKAKKSTARITCTNANSGLMDFLLKNAPPTVRWRISATKLQIISPKITCLNGCVYMQCPIGTGTYRCCKYNKPC